jgi:hypothetical protein
VRATVSVIALDRTGTRSARCDKGVIMRQATTYQLSVCADCIIVLANGTDGDDRLIEVSRRIANRWGDECVNLIADGEDLGFCCTTCEGCGGYLAGDRFVAVHYEETTD